MAMHSAQAREPLDLFLRDARSTGAPQMLSLPEQIAAQIGDRILAGEIKPGARITEMEMVAQFQVSRAPIREAFRILERERLIRIHPRRGVMVTLLTRQDVIDIFEVIAGLYQIAGKRLGESRSPAAIAAMEEAIEFFARSLNQSVRGDDVAAVGQKAGLALVHAAGNSRLEAIVHSLVLESFRYRRLVFQSVAQRKRALKLWRELLAAVRKGDSAASGRIAASMIEGNRDAALKILEEGMPEGELDDSAMGNMRKSRNR